MSDYLVVVCLLFPDSFVEVSMHHETHNMPENPESAVAISTLLKDGVGSIYEFRHHLLIAGSGIFSVSE